MTDLHRLCDQYNAARRRFDVEWYVAGGNLALGTPLHEITARGRALEREAEAERARWKQGQDVPRGYGG